MYKLHWTRLPRTCQTSALSNRDNIIRGERERERERTKSGEKEQVTRQRRWTGVRASRVKSSGDGKSFCNVCLQSPRPWRSINLLVLSSLHRHHIHLPAPINSCAPPHSPCNHPIQGKSLRHKTRGQPRGIEREIASPVEHKAMSMRLPEDILRGLEQLEAQFAEALSVHSALVGGLGYGWSLRTESDVQHKAWQNEDHGRWNRYGRDL